MSESNVKQTSLRAFLGILSDGTSTRVRGRIYNTLKASRVSMTRMELVRETGITVNTLSGQVTPMLEAGAIFVTGEIECSVTGRMVEALTSSLQSLDAPVEIIKRT